MAINNYTTAKKAGEVLNDTLEHDVMSAYLKAEDTLRGTDGLIDRSKLKDKGTRKNISTMVYSSLVGVALSYFGATTTDETRKEQLTFGLFGMNTPTIQQFMDAAEDKAGTVEFLGYAKKNTPFKYFLGQNAVERPKTQLEDNDAEEVVKLTKTESVVDYQKLTIDDMVELLSEHEEKGTITPAFLKGKKYLV